MSQDHYTQPDVWLLHAIALASGKEPATLRDILSAGDYINHAIFTWSEIQIGLSKLLGASCIESEDKRFKLNQRLTEEYAHIAKQHRSIYKQTDALEVYLRALPVTKDNSAEFVLSITQTDFEVAVKEYQQSFNKPTGKRKT
jgi:hypothetical protein